MKKFFGIVALLLMSVLISYLSFADKKATEPHNYYNVYLKSELLGVIESPTELENYIDEQCGKIKEKYGVDKVYAPKDLEVIRSVTYLEKVNTVKEIYDKINEKDAFTIEGYKAKIAIADGKELIIYVSHKEVFSDALEQLIIAFVGQEKYDAYKNNTQEDIVLTGERIDDVYIDNEITTKQEKIPVTENIYYDSLTLSQYLLYGDNSQYKKYVVKTGDTIQSIIDANEISIEEFLITNPEIKSSQSLLYAGEVVTINTINTKIDVVETSYLVEDIETRYAVEEKRDNTVLEGTTKKIQEGKNGVNRVSQNIKTVNGVITYVSPVSNEEIKPSTSEIWVVGGKVIPNVGSLTIWAWPTDSGYRITSNYGWRYHPIYHERRMHNGIDIAGLGYGKPIYAANNGTIMIAQYHKSFGNYIVINHNNGYYTLYAHQKAFASSIKVGKTVTRGQVIGYIGSTGDSTGPHLHFEIHKGSYGNRISPWTFYSK